MSEGDRVLSTPASSFAAHVLTPARRPAIDRGGGARTVPLVTAELGATSFLNGITQFEPGAAIAQHTHNCLESVLVIEGVAVLDVDGVETPLRPWDTTVVPANVPHRFRNASTSRAMAIFWTYASVDATRAIVGSSTPVRIDAEQQRAGGDTAVREVVEISVEADATAAFEAAVAEAAPLFQRAAGCRSFELTRVVELPSSYRLFVEWTTVEDHLTGFRGSPAFSAWRALVTPYLAAPMSAGHVRHVWTGF